MAIRRFAIDKEGADGGPMVLGEEKMRIPVELGWAALAKGWRWVLLAMPVERQLMVRVGLRGREAGFGSNARLMAWKRWKVVVGGWRWWVGGDEVLVKKKWNEEHGERLIACVCPW